MLQLKKTVSIQKAKDVCVKIFTSMDMAFKLWDRDQKVRMPDKDRQVSKDCLGKQGTLSQLWLLWGRPAIYGAEKASGISVPETKLLAGFPHINSWLSKIRQDPAMRSCPLP